jgi:hypothetical protein
MTDHIGDATQMVPMTQERLNRIEARCASARQHRDQRTAKRWEIHYANDVNALLDEIMRLREKLEDIALCEELEEERRVFYDE